MKRSKWPHKREPPPGCNPAVLLTPSHPLSPPLTPSHLLTFGTHRLTWQLFEDVLPEAVLDCRDAVDEEGKSAGFEEYLVKFEDCDEAIWVPERYVSEEVVQDYAEGLTYDVAEKVLDHRNRGDSRSYKVLWMDGKSSWAPEEWVSPDLIYVYENGRVPDGVSPL